MNPKVNTIQIVMAEDDEDDRLIAHEALEEASILNELHFVSNGEELLDYLYQRGQYSDPAPPRPGLILLDLNMPKMDGREALEAIKADPHLRQIPVVVLTTSKADEDVIKAYDLGVNSFITKPVTFTGLVNVIKTIGHYWLGIVTLPQDTS